MTQTSTRERPDIEMHLNGVDFGVVVDNYVPGEPGTRWEPAEPPEFEWHFIDDLGYRADWIMDQMTEDDMDTIETVIFDNSREG